MDIALNQHSSVCQATVSRVLDKVVMALCNPLIFNKYVIFPKNLDELNAARKGWVLKTNSEFILFIFRISRFYDKFKLPGVIGVIDCTHIAIVPPCADDPIYPEHVYINRKGYHSINSQLVSIINYILSIWKI